MKLFYIAPLLVAGALMAACSPEESETPPPAEPETAATPEPEPAAPVEMAEATDFTASLAAPEGVDSSGTGSATLTLDPEAKTLTYSITYEGLTGDAVAAHIHGPAAEGENAGVQVPFDNPASPITGTAELTDEQIADLEAGKYYVNIHTQANPGGEIRGQITAVE